MAFVANDFRANSPIAPATRHEYQLFVCAQPVLLPFLLASRFAAPLRRVPKLGWLVVDPLLARQVYNDSEHFRMTGEGAVGDFWSQVLGEWFNDIMEGPGHHDLRSRTRDLFTGKSSEQLVREAAGDMFPALTADLLAGKTIDIARFVRILVGKATAELTGMTGADIAELFPNADGDLDASYLSLFEMAENFTQLGLETMTSFALQDTAVQKAKSIVTTLSQRVPARFATAGADTSLGRCRESGLTEEKTKGLVALMIIAGNGTSSSSLTRTVALLHDTGDHHRLIAEPSLIPDATREGLRATSLVPISGRHVAKDVVLGGRQLRGGEQVKVMNWTINRRFGGFRLDRGYVPETRQIWFGGGRHLCLGANLVHAEFAATLGALVAAGRPWRITARRAVRTSLIPAYDRLDLRLA